MKIPVVEVVLFDTATMLPAPFTLQLFNIEYDDLFIIGSDNPRSGSNPIYSALKHRGWLHKYIPNMFALHRVKLKYLQPDYRRKASLPPTAAKEAYRDKYNNT